MNGRLCLVVAGMLASHAIFGDCRCPPGAQSRNLLIAVSTPNGGVVACGYEDERRVDTVVASEFQIFRCGGDVPVLEFGALQSAILRETAAALEVREVERWPFGRDWQWVQVPVYEWHLSASDPEPQSRRTVTALPQVAQRAIDDFTANVRSYDSAEEYVARLFTSAIAGDDEAEALFLTMSDNAGLDGAAAETYGQAIATYNAWREARVRLRKE